MLKKYEGIAADKKTTIGKIITTADFGQYSRFQSQIFTA